MKRSLRMNERSNMLNKTIFGAAVENVRITRGKSKLVDATTVSPKSFRLHFSIFQDLTKSYLHKKKKMESTIKCP